MVHFVRTFTIMRAKGVSLIAIKEVRNYNKNCIAYIKNIFEEMAKTFLKMEGGMA